MDLKSDYLTKHLYNYMGNKRALLDFINETVEEIKKEIGKEKVKCLDGFSGSGCVARLLKYHSTELYVNDLEKYSQIINEAYLSDPTEEEKVKINEYIDKMNEIKEYKKGIISNFYSPKDDKNIKMGERVFYTNENSQIIDTIRDYIDKMPEKYRNYILAQVLIKASIHVNTAGVFKGFYKGKKTKIGKFGGDGENALTRIKGKIILDYPIYSEIEHENKVNIYNKDINELIKELPKVDIAYYDPPYNGHPYGSNYFMLNLIIDNKNITNEDISEVSGIKKDWKHSNYNKRISAEVSFKNLLKYTNSEFILISYNNEGIIKEEDWIGILDYFKEKYNYQWSKKIKEYNTYRGSRNLKNRSNKVNEIIWIIDKRNCKEVKEEFKLNEVKKSKKVKKDYSEILNLSKNELIEQINKLNISKLKDICRALKIKGFSKYKKDDIEELRTKMINSL